MSLRDDYHDFLSGSRRKRRIPFFVKILGYALLGVVFMIALFRQNGDSTIPELTASVSASNGRPESSLSEAEVARYLEERALSGNPVKLDDITNSDLMTEYVPLSDFMNNPYTLTPFGKEGDTRYKDVTLTLECTESIHRPCTDAEEYAIYQAYEYVEEQPSEEGTEEISPTPRVQPAPAPTSAPTPSVTPSPSPAPSPTPTPIPTVTVSVPGYGTVTMTAEDYARAAAEIASGVDEERTVTYGYTIPGKTIIDYLNNKYHIPWQALYTCASFTTLIDEDFTLDEEIIIRPERFEEICDFFSSFFVSYNLDYWDEKLDLSGKTISLDNCGDMLGDAYIEYYVENPEPFDPSEEGVVTIKWRKGLKPLIQFKKIEEWALMKSYAQLDFTKIPVDFYSFSMDELTRQAITSDTVSSSLLTYFNNYEYDKNVDIPLFPGYGLENLPDCELILADFDHAYDLIDDTAGGFTFAVADMDWITGSSLGEQIILSASKYLGYIYSQDKRFNDGYADCSSFVYRALKDIDIDVSFRGAINAAEECRGMVFRGEIIADFYDETILMPGDLLFWRTTDPNHAAYPRYLHIYHVGFFCGINEDGEAIIMDASSTLGHVVCRTMWGREKIVAIGRIFD